MACNSCSTEIQPYGASPTNMQWKVVRGDTSTLKIEFWEDDEVTAIDTDGWIYAATAYDPKTGTTYELTTEPTSNYVNIIADPTVTELWGTGFASVVAELAFDLQIIKPDDTVWTPVIGTICVLGDITGSL